MLDWFSRHRRGVFAATITAVVVCIIAIAAVLITQPRAHSRYVPRNAGLRASDLFFYPSRLAGQRPKAFIFFFGNDVGFWKPHQELAEFLADGDYDVVGYNMKPLLSSLPEAASVTRDSAYVAAILPLVSAARVELRAEHSPVVLMGHSVGAEVALWTAAHVAIPDVAGVVAMSPGSRGHLRVTWTDLANGPEPTGPDSWGIAETVKLLRPSLRVAVVRGDHDLFRYADSAIVPAGGDRLKLSIVPLASHSLKRIIVARYIVRDAVEWVLRR